MIPMWTACKCESLDGSSRRGELSGQSREGPSGQVLGEVGMGLAAHRDLRNEMTSRV